MDFSNFAYFEQIIQWLLTHGVRIILILVGAFLVNRLVKSIVGKLDQHWVDNAFSLGKISPEIEAKRVATIRKAFTSVTQTILWALAILTILPELGVSISPLLTGLGIGGLIMGIGSRNVVQDYWSGLFILMEDHFRVGEKVKIADLEGTVKNFNLRRTILKDSKGYFSYIPNSQITKVTNFSRKITKESEDK
ncbi:MAG: mechanosensitive ion channel [Candidatus Gribaldobacteria bacterium]|nr:mechanosensitive ion channel [Candidatus Gribaldobacteria bacterium]